MTTTIASRFSKYTTEQLNAFYRALWENRSVSEQVRLSGIPRRTCFDMRKAWDDHERVIQSSDCVDAIAYRIKKEELLQASLKKSRPQLSSSSNSNASQKQRLSVCEQTTSKPISPPHKHALQTQNTISPLCNISPSPYPNSSTILTQEPDFNPYDYRGFVITSCQNDTDIDIDAYLALKHFCKQHKYRFIVIPVYSRFTTSSVWHADPEDMVFEDLFLRQNLRLGVTMRVPPTTMNPLAGKEHMTRGESIVIASPQMAFRALPVLEGHPPILHTSMSISKAKDCYKEFGQAPEKAKRYHKIGAVLVKINEKGSCNFRNLEIMPEDKRRGFYDIDGYWTATGHTPLFRGNVKAVVPPDIHVRVICKEFKRNMFTNSDSILNTLLPDEVIFHDLFDCQTVSHHDDHNHWMRAAKAMQGLDDLEQEIIEMCEFLRETRIPGVTYRCSGSNHPEHINQFLRTAPSHDQKNNAKIYHYLNYLVLSQVEQNGSGPVFKNPLKLWIDNSVYAEELKDLNFMSRRESYKICGIEVSLHGDKAANGAKGSPTSFSRMIDRIIHGHGHTPYWSLDSMGVGTGSRYDLPYTGGPSSWMKTCAVVYENGQIQAITIMDDGWR